MERFNFTNDSSIATKTAYTIQLCLLDFQGEYVARALQIGMTGIGLIPTTLVFVSTTIYYYWNR